MHPTTRPLPRSLRLAGRLLISAAVLWWLGFILLVARAEGAPAYTPAAAIGLPLAAVAALIWPFPRAGAAIALAAGIAAAAIFPHPAPRLTMALPLILGAALILTPALIRAPRTPAHP